MEGLVLLGRLVAVFGLLGATLWGLRRLDGARSVRRTASTVQVVGSARLAKGASVAVVRIGQACYALGVTDHAVSLLTEAELVEPAAATSAEPAHTGTPSFATALAEQMTALRRRRPRPTVSMTADGSAAIPSAALLPAGMDAPVDTDLEQPCPRPRRSLRGRRAAGRALGYS